jgi:hypothetical protein
MKPMFPKKKISTKIKKMESDIFGDFETFFEEENAFYLITKPIWNRILSLMVENCFEKTNSETIDFKDISSHLEKCFVNFLKNFNLKLDERNDVLKEVLVKYMLKCDKYLLKVNLFIIFIYLFPFYLLFLLLLFIFFFFFLLFSFFS